MKPYTINPARYAKGRIAIHTTPDGSGWKTLAATIISSMKNVRYSHRENAYIVSPRCAARFEVAFARIEELRARHLLVEEAHKPMRADGDPTNNELSNLRVVTL